MFGRNRFNPRDYPLLDAEVDRLGLGTARIYDAVAAVCKANGIDPPLPTAEVIADAQRIERALADKQKYQ